MPTYDFICKNCGNKFEQYQHTMELVPTKCPRCESWEVERQIGKGGLLQFKGAGFYATDYKAGEASD